MTVMFSRKDRQHLSNFHHLTSSDRRPAAGGECVYCTHISVDVGLWLFSLKI